MNPGKVGSVFVIEAAIQSKSKKMKKKSLILSMMVVVAISANCQSEIRKEVGIEFRNLDYFGVTYRTGTEQALWRISGFSIGASKDESYGSGTVIYTSSSAGVSLQFGREFRKAITDKFQFRYGLDLSYSYTVTSSNYDSPSSHTKLTVGVSRPGVVGVLGANVLINEHFLVGAELQPQISYKIGHQKEENLMDGSETNRDIPGFEFWVRDLLALSVIYRFHKSDIAH
jgi:hypothetical protein